MMPVVTFKASVRLDPPTSALARLVGVADQLARVLGVNVLVSCGREDHPPTDPHTLGRAIDLSVGNLTTTQVLQAVQSLRSMLGEAFYVQYETPTPPLLGSLKNLAVVNPQATAPHLHVQVVKGVVWPPVDAPELAQKV